RTTVSRLSETIDRAGIDTDNLTDSEAELARQSDDLRRELDRANDELDQNADSARRAGSETDDLADQVAQARNAFLGFLGLDLGVDMLRDLSYLADGYSNLTSRIKLAVGEGDAFHQGLSDVRTTANNTGTALESVAGLYTKLYRATRDLGTSQEDVARLTDTISKSFIVSGASAQEA
ncbi:tape measure protein, partial [Wenyingzhuangia sp. 1_MG-2023]|nr:tape measure protein [Wenyingzhuangia sp. 1_MG-2023]